MKEKTLNAEVSAHSKYGSGAEQGIGFRGIDGFWTLAPSLRERFGERWPPALGTVLNVHLRAKPKPNGNGYYQDILALGKATGPAESWDNDSGPSGSKDESIARQVVVKAEAEVLAAMIPGDSPETADPKVGKLYMEWRLHCAELWGKELPDNGPEVVPFEEPLADTFEDDIPF